MATVSTSSFVPLTSITPRDGSIPAICAGSSVFWSDVNKAAVGDARALVLHVDDAAHTRLERRAHAVEQVRQCAIVRRFLDGQAGRVRLMQFAQIGFE